MSKVTTGLDGLANLPLPGCCLSDQSLVFFPGLLRLWSSDAGEVVLAAGGSAGGGAALSHHCDLGAEVVAVAAQRGLLILNVRSQKPLEEPPAPLTLNLCLHLSI